MLKNITQPQIKNHTHPEKWMHRNKCRLPNLIQSHQWVQDVTISINLILITKMIFKLKKMHKKNKSFAFKMMINWTKTLEIKTTLAKKA